VTSPLTQHADRFGHTELDQVREAELPGCAYPSWSLGTRGGTGAGKFALVPKLQLGNAIREALLQLPALAPTISWQLQPPPTDANILR